MFLKKECDEIGEWFNDTYPLYTLTVKWKPAVTKTGLMRENYLFEIEGPRGFHKQTGQYLLRGRGLEDKIQSTYVTNMRRAIAEAIEPEKGMKMTSISNIYVHS